MIPNQNNIKYKKKHKRKIERTEYRQSYLKYGTYGIKALENGYLKIAQLERIKVDLLKKVKEKMHIFFNFQPILGLTSKGTARMGAGKGDVEDWYMPIEKGKVVIEFINSKMTETELEKLINYSRHKWAIKIKLTKKQKGNKE